MAQANSVSLEIKIFTDAEEKTFANGGSVVKVQAGFLESSYFDKKSNKMVYKNGFITVKKNLSEKANQQQAYAVRNLKKNDRAIVVGHLGFEEWTNKSNQKAQKVVLIADSIYPIGEAQQQQQRSNGRSEESYDAPDPDEQSGGREEIPF